MQVSSPYKMMEMDECEASLAAITRQMSLGTLERETNKCEGFICSEDIFANENFPPFRASIVDGYVVVNPNTEYLIKGDIIIGRDTPLPHIEKDEAYYITTGSAVPPNGLYVIPVEHCLLNYSTGKVSIKNFSPPKNNNIREIGSDINKGECIIFKGKKLNATSIGAALSCRNFNLKVYEKPRVVIISTGNELLSVKDGINNTKSNNIIDTNTDMLRSLIESWDAAVVQTYRVRDNADELKKIIIQAVDDDDAHIVASTGSVSMGICDLIKPILEEMKMQILFGRVNMKPGKPMTAAVLTTRFKTSRLMLAMPGNPVSAWVCSHLFIHSAIHQLYKRSHTWPKVTVTAVQDLQGDSERPEYHRAIVWTDSGYFKAVSTGMQISSRLLSTVEANAIILIPKGGAVKKGENVDAFLIGAPLTQAIEFSENESFRQINMGCNCGSNKCNELHQASTVPNPNHSNQLMNPALVKIGILICSDTAAKNPLADSSGVRLKYASLLPGAVRNAAETALLKLFPNASIDKKIVADERGSIEKSVQAWVKFGYQLVLTSGGTGLGNRDVTINTLVPLFDKNCTGLSTLMMVENLKITPFAALSNCACGIIKRTLVVCVPGSPKAVTECIQALQPVVSHALKLISS